MKYKKEYPSPVGKITLLANEKSLEGAWLENQRYFGGGYCLQEIAEEKGTKNDSLNKAVLWLDTYFNREIPMLNFTLEPQGTLFQKKVWKQVEKLPYGTITTYGRLADDFEKKENRKTSARAIGTAIGKNPLLLFVPCHRVIGKNNNLLGYEAGLINKQYLLNLEQQQKTRTIF